MGTGMPVPYNTLWISAPVGVLTNRNAASLHTPDRAINLQGFANLEGFGRELLAGKRLHVVRRLQFVRSTKGLPALSRLTARSGRTAFSLHHHLARFHVTARQLVGGGRHIPRQKH